MACPCVWPLNTHVSWRGLWLPGVAMAMRLLSHFQFAAATQVQAWAHGLVGPVRFANRMVTSTMWLGQLRVRMNIHVTTPQPFDCRAKKGGHYSSIQIPVRDAKPLIHAHPRAGKHKSINLVIARLFTTLSTRGSGQAQSFIYLRGSRFNFRVRTKTTDTLVCGG